MNDKYKQNENINTLIKDINTYVDVVFTEKESHNLLFKKLDDRKQNIEKLLKIAGELLENKVRLNTELLSQKGLDVLKERIKAMREDDSVVFQSLEPLTAEAIKEKESLLDTVGLLVFDLVSLLSEDKKIDTIVVGVPDDIFTYKNIVFNFTKKTLEMGKFRGNNAIKLELDLEINETNLKKKTRSAIKLLFAILNKVKNNNKISFKRTDYSADVNLISTRLGWSNQDFDIGEYKTNVNAIFKYVGLGWNVVKKSRIEECELKEME